MIDLSQEWLASLAIALASLALTHKRKSGWSTLEYHMPYLIQACIYKSLLLIMISYSFMMIWVGCSRTRIRTGISREYSCTLKKHTTLQRNTPHSKGHTRPPKNTLALQRTHSPSKEYPCTQENDTHTLKKHTTL